MGVMGVIGCEVASYGANLKRLRAGKPQESLAKKVGLARQANLPSYENDRRFPTPELVRQHARMLDCATSDLMRGVVTEFDRLRWPSLTEAELENLLTGFDQLPKAHRTAVLDECARVASLPRDAPIPSSEQSTSVIPARDRRRARRKHSA